MAIPSIALIPTGTKAGKLYSVLPEDGSGDFTVVRATTATRVNENGLIESVGVNVPRLDYTNGGCPVLLTEPQSTNLVLNSESISLTPTKNGTFVDNFAVSPDGTQNATKLTATSTDPFFYQSVAFTATSYTASIYVKGIGSSIGKDFRIVLGGTSTNPKLKVPSEWTRFEYTVLMTSGSANAGIEIPDPAVTGDEVLVWGWQVEALSYATSYIPNYGTSAGVTRNADQVTDSGDVNDFNSTEGVLMVEIAALANDLTRRNIAVSDGTGNNMIQLYYNPISNGFQGLVKSAGATSVNIFPTLSDITQINKIVFKWKVNDFALWINGFEVGTDTSGATPIGLNELNFTEGDGVSNPFYGKTKQLQVFKSALTSLEIETLTSWESFILMASAQQYTIY